MALGATTAEIAAYFYRSEEKRALEAFYSRQMRERNMYHDGVAALRVVRERELKPFEEQIAQHQDANTRLQEKIETLRQHLNLSRLDDIVIYCLPSARRQQTSGGDLLI
jgi:phosphopantetheinyl transferase